MVRSSAAAQYRSGSRLGLVFAAAVAVAFARLYGDQIPDAGLGLINDGGSQQPALPSEAGARLARAS